MSTVCTKCKMEGLHLKYYELKERYALFENNEQPHICSANPYDVQESVNKFSQKFHSKIKKKIPIWCEECNHFYDPYVVCDHILATGFKEEIDDITYFGSSFEAVELRKRRKAELKKLHQFEQTEKKINPVDLRDFEKSHESTKEEIKKINEKIKEEQLKKQTKDKQEAQEISEEMSEDILLDLKNEPN